MSFKYGMGVGVFPIVAVIDFFYELIGEDTANILNFNHSVTALYGSENLKWEVGYKGIVADKALFRAKNNYNHGFMAGVTFKHTGRHGILFNNSNKPDRVFFKVNTGFFIINRINNTKLFPNLTLSCGLYLKDRK